MEARIRKLAERLERFSDQIMRCRVTVEAPQGHQRQGGLFEVTIDITVPGREIAIGHSPPEAHAHEDAYVALRDAFRAARRKLEDYARQRRHEVKTHIELPVGRVCELKPEQDFGRIETDNGRLVYFHRNSVLGRAFDDLTAGTEVRFAEEPGDNGPQASAVHVLGSHHAN